MLVLEPVVAAISQGLIDRCRELRTFDLLADYAQRYSVAVVAEVLGVPRADTQRLLAAEPGSGASPNCA